MNDNNQKYWKRFVEGEDEALTTIYYEYFDVLYNFGMKYTSERTIVEDCIQNLFLDLLKNRKKLKAVINFKYFLMKAMRNQISYEHRKTKKFLSVENPEQLDFRISFSIENSLITNENKQIQSKFIDLVTQKLTNRQKEALYLKFNCGFDYDQISELMDISVESARTMVYRTIKVIKKTFDIDKHANMIFFNFFRPFLRGSIC